MNAIDIKKPSDKAFANDTKLLEIINVFKEFKDQNVCPVAGIIIECNVTNLLHAIVDYCNDNF